MQVSLKYKSLAHTLQCLKIQVEDSLPHVAKYIPDTIQNPEQLFYFLKDNTTYEKDPPGRELLQTVQTLLTENNKHGVPGYGDCDCFTILVLASCRYLGFSPQQVCIVGNSKFSPSHIYSLVYDPSKKKMVSMDLTNPYFNMERPYKYKQTLNFMMLELADERWIPLAGKTKRKAKKAEKAKRKVIRQEGKTTRVSNRVTKRSNRSTGKTARKGSRQLRRTDRTDQKGDRKYFKRSKKSAKQEKGLIKVKGKQEILRARQQKKLDNIMNPDTSWDNEFSPDADNIMMPDSQGAGYEANNYQQQMVPDEYAEFELLPEEEGEEEELYWEGEEEELSGPFLIPGIINSIKKVVGKAKGAAEKAKGSAAGNLIKQGASKYNEITALKSKNAFLSQELERAKRNQIIYGVTGSVAGVVIGTVLPKLFKK